MAEDEDLFQPLDLADEPQDEPEIDEPETDETPEPEAAEPAKEATPAPEKAETMVPLAALQAERATVKATKERLDRIEAMLAAQSAPKEKPAPDIYDDPAGYQAYVQSQVQSQVSNVQAEMSERFTRQTYGDEFVNEAFEAAQASGVVDQFRGRKDAWGDLAKWHKAQKAVAEIGDDPAAWRERETARIEQEVTSRMAAQSVKQPAFPASPSLAGQTNIGNRVAPAWSGPTPLDEILGGGS